MLSRFRPRLTYANVVSTLCLFIVLGGTAWAVAANSVGTRELKNGAVTASKIKDGAVTAPKLARDALAPEAVRLVRMGNGNCSRTPGQFCVYSVGSGIDEWQNYGHHYAPAGFFKDRAGVVHLQGSVWDFYGFRTIFYLPPGYRPRDGTRNFVVESDDSSASPPRRFNNVTIGVQGAVRTNGAASFLSLDGISFRP